MCISSAPTHAISNEGYESPYSVKFDTPLNELLLPDQEPPRNDIKLESSTTFSDWYSDETKQQCGNWGPHARLFPPAFRDSSTAIKQQRLLAVALKYIGLPYQHHHIPDWDPPSDWPWKQVSAGKNSKGLDCSNFTSWVYNYGLGIKFVSAIAKQADMTEAEMSDGSKLPIHRLPTLNTYESLISTLHTGDLLFIRHTPATPISHVVIWVGSYASSPDKSPLVIDCTDTKQLDCNGKPIPTGVHLRPFTPTSWYYKCFDHALRIL